MTRGIISLTIGLVCVLNFARTPFGLWEAFGLATGVFNLFVAALVFRETRP